MKCISDDNKSDGYGADAESYSKERRNRDSGRRDSSDEEAEIWSPALSGTRKKIEHSPGGDLQSAREEHVKVMVVITLPKDEPRIG